MRCGATTGTEKEELCGPKLGGSTYSDVSLTVPMLRSSVFTENFCPANDKDTSSDAAQGNV